MTLISIKTFSPLKHDVTTLSEMTTAGIVNSLADKGLVEKSVTGGSKTEL